VRVLFWIGAVPAVLLFKDSGFAAAGMCRIPILSNPPKWAFSWPPSESDERPAPLTQIGKCSMPFCDSGPTIALLLTLPSKEASHSQMYTSRWSNRKAAVAAVSLPPAFPPDVDDVMEEAAAAELASIR